MTKEDLHMQTPRFDWSFNLGHVLTVIAILGSIGGSAMAISTKLENFEQRITTAERAVLQHGPKLEVADKINDRQESRLDAQAEAIKGMRSDISETNRKVGALAEITAGMNAKIDTLIRKN